MNNQKSKHQIPNTKYQKGITLVALIITIIVLLILAMVAISAVQDGGIVDKAKQARDNYAQAQTKENELLSGYLNEINNAYSQGSTTGSSTENKKKKISFTIESVGPNSTYFERKQYEAEEGMTWQEWCDSDYNVDGYACSYKENNASGYSFVYPTFPSSGDHVRDDISNEYTGGDEVDPYDQIIDGFHYALNWL